MDGIPIWPVVGYGTGWMLAVLFGVYIVRSVMRGDWVSRREHDEKAHEANEWRTEGRIKDQAIIATVDQTRDAVLAQGESLHNFLAMLQERFADKPKGES